MNWLLALLLPCFLGTVASVIGIGSGLNSLFGGGGDGGGGGQGGAAPNTGVYVPTGLSAADRQWQQLLQSQQGLMGGGVQNQLLSAIGESFNRSQANPFTNQFLDRSNQAGALYGQDVGTSLNLAALLQSLSGQAGQEMGALDRAGAQTYATALDPQHALYNRTLQQVLDTGRAGQAARGLGVSAEGQRLENQDVSNFNIDWQNQQLQRQLAGLQGFAGAANAAGNQGQLAGRLGAGGMDAAALAPQFAQQAGQIPMQAWQQYAAMPGQASSQFIQQLMQLMQPYQGIQNQIMQYLNRGIGGSANAAKQDLGQQQFQAQQQAGGLQALGTGLQGLSSAFSQGTQPSSFLTGNFQNPFAGNDPFANPVFPSMTGG